MIQALRRNLFLEFSMNHIWESEEDENPEQKKKKIPEEEPVFSDTPPIGTDSEKKQGQSAGGYDTGWSPGKHKTGYYDKKESRACCNQDEDKDDVCDCCDCCDGFEECKCDGNHNDICDCCEVCDGNGNGLCDCLDCCDCDGNGICDCCDGCDCD